MTAQAAARKRIGAVVKNDHRPYRPRWTGYPLSVRIDLIRQLGEVTLPVAEECPRRHPVWPRGRHHVHGWTGRCRRRVVVPVAPDRAVATGPAVRRKARDRRVEAATTEVLDRLHSLDKECGSHFVE